jgi:hypothetical protein
MRKCHVSSKETWGYFTPRFVKLITAHGSEQSPSKDKLINAPQSTNQSTLIFPESPHDDKQRNTLNINAIPVRVELAHFEQSVCVT